MKTSRMFPLGFGFASVTPSTAANTAFTPVSSLAALVVGFVMSAFVQADSVHLMFQGQWPPPGTDNALIYSVAVSGNHAYLTDLGYGLAVLDISNPGAPQRIGGLASSNRLYSIAMAGSHAYVVDSLTNLEIIDIRSPSQPQRVGGFALSRGGIGSVTVSGDRAYVTYEDSVDILDISDRTSPHQVGRWNGLGFSTNDLPSGVFALQASGAYAYVAEGFGGMAVLDISDPNSPLEVARYKHWLGIYGLAVSGKYAFLAQTGWGLRVLDISDPTNAVMAGSVAMSNPAGQVAVAGEYVYVANRFLTIYRITELPGAIPAITEYSVVGRSLWLGWNEAARGMKLQQTPSLTKPTWQDVPGSELTNQVQVTFGSGLLPGFFKLVKP